MEHSKYSMKPELFAPEEIERRSMEIISRHLQDKQLDPDHQAVIKRVIHTTADFDYADHLWFSPDVVPAAIAALKEGADIVCDTNMAKAGINKRTLQKLGGKVHCFMADEDVEQEAKARGITRAAVSMEKAASLKKPLIFAIGNAPTALLRLRRLIDENQVTPRLIIGAPVGFVNVVEAKELFVNADIPAIIARGRKGGSNVAAAICNALLYTALPRS